MGIFHKNKAKKTEREKLEERREEVLARGRKFKYPLQYAKYKIITLTVFISIISLVAFGFLGHYALYKLQSTDDLLYRFTQLIPVSVASIDGEKVRYSDYLLIYKAATNPLEKQGAFSNQEDAKNMQKHHKKEALKTAEKYTYAIKLARELKIKVQNQEIDKVIDDHRKVGGVERSYEAFSRIIHDNFNLTMSEYRRMIYLSLITEKVSEKIDDTASLVAKEVEEKIKEGKKFSEIADEMGDKVSFESTGGMVNNMNIDGGRSSVAMKMEKGQVSDRFTSSSGSSIYFITLLDKTASEISYESLEIKYNELQSRIDSIREAKKIKERINLD